MSSTLTPDLTRRIERLPADLQTEFPCVSLEAIKRDVEEGVDELITVARFDEFVPVLVHKAVRERLRGACGESAETDNREAA